MVRQRPLLRRRCVDRLAGELADPRDVPVEREVVVGHALGQVGQVRAQRRLDVPVLVRGVGLEQGDDRVDVVGQREPVHRSLGSRLPALDVTAKSSARMPLWMSRYRSNATVANGWSVAPGKEVVRVSTGVVMVRSSVGSGAASLGGSVPPVHGSIVDHLRKAGS